MDEKEARKHRLEEYWQANVRLITILLIIWAAITFIPPLFINQFNQIVIAGFPLGYYIGGQGALIIYVVMIFYYAWYMNRLDEHYGMVDK
jgi:putative solute:sodium symporter small subunit